MIEFQLTIYMCSHCTRVHNAAQDCLRHELDDHPPPTAYNTMNTSETPKAKFTTAERGEIASTSSSTPFTITDNDVKPDMDESDLYHQNALVGHDETDDQVMDETQENAGELFAENSFDANSKTGGRKPANRTYTKQSSSSSTTFRKTKTKGQNVISFLVKSAGGFVHYN